jgi:hypothetical protein
MNNNEEKRLFCPFLSAPLVPLSLREQTLIGGGALRVACTPECALYDEKHLCCSLKRINELITK